MNYQFKAFISYSHESDKEMATHLKVALHRFGRRWYEFRSMRVFCDQTTLSVTPELWSTIVKLLDASEHLVLLASPSAAQSRWVNKEILHWLESRGDRATSSIFIIVTRGALRWNEDRRDFDDRFSISLPSALKGGDYMGLRPAIWQGIKEHLLAARA